MKNSKTEKQLLKSEKKLKKIIKNCEEKLDKYYSLVAYARKDPNSDNKHVIKFRKKVEKLYPEEVNELVEEQDNWAHGFNSGMLAALRYVLHIEEIGTKYANEQFPLLDS